MAAELKLEDSVMNYESAEPKFQSAILTTDAEKNLLWLSLASGQSFFKDPNFTTRVRRSTQFVVSTGEIDLVNKYSDIFKVSDFLLRPPACRSSKSNHVNEIYPRLAALHRLRGHVVSSY